MYGKKLDLNPMIFLEDSFQNQFGGCYLGSTYLGCKGEGTRFRDLGVKLGL